MIMRIVIDMMKYGAERWSDRWDGLNLIFRTIYLRSWKIVLTMSHTVEEAVAVLKALFGDTAEATE